MKKNIIITGASKGIGKETAKQLQKKHNVIITSSSTKNLKKTATELKTQHIKCDVTKEQDIINLKKELSKKQIDVLILNAGIGYFEKLEETTNKQYDQMFNTNVKGVFLTLKHFLPKLKKQNEAQIIIISSMAGINPVPNGSVYAATKWAIQGLTKSLKQEIRDTKIKVALILPGSVNTQFFDGKKITPNKKRILQPKAIANAIQTIIDQDKSSDIDEIIIRPSLL